MSEMSEQAPGSRVHRWLHRATLALRERAAPLRLLGVDRLGRRALLDGAPYVESFGAITIGDDFRLSSTPDQSHLVTGRDGVITIGDRVSVGPGAAIAAELRVTIGNGAQIGPYVMIMDTDFHDLENMRASSLAQPVIIEDDVRIDGRVTILKGVHIGRGAWIAAGSVVTRAVPAGAFASGVPARVRP
jgi:acetyltransferase-like isoleucine patch superfamily enzyme